MALSYLLLEDGSKLLLEDGSGILTEDSTATILPISENGVVLCYETVDAKNNIVPLLMVGSLGAGVVPVRFVPEGPNVVPVRKVASDPNNVVPACEVQ